MLSTTKNLCEYDFLLPLHLLPEAAKSCRSQSDLAIYFEIPLEDVNKIITYYRKKYGEYYFLREYVIYFEPFGVLYKI